MPSLRKCQRVEVLHEGMSIVSINGESDTTKFPDLLNTETNVRTRLRNSVVDVTYIHDFSTY